MKRQILDIISCFVGLLGVVATVVAFHVLQPGAVDTEL